MIALMLILIGVFSRLVIHEPNFNPVIAIAFCGGMFLNKRQAIYAPVLLLVLSDLIIGLHNVVFYTWGSILLVSLLGSKMDKRDIKSLVLGSTVSAFIFYLATNFGVWATGYYGISLEGLVKSYVLAIPFFRNSLLSTLVYSVGFYYMFYSVKRCSVLAQEILGKK